ncbi:uncharacterized protein LOC120292563 [Eucalyptus grandis]|uniref:uncharacterized protein LOC120292563 n=1 Tax=Eucalyptus grandis TaxID=71139 RepID=UPI00192F07F1|nr:uncharacterized protein LOC120292563 [Eucalyptus grandis]
MTYLMNYTPSRYVRISCLRGNPIAIFFIQLIGVPVPGLEPEFQPVVSHLLPHIVAHKQDAHDLHLQLLQYMTCRLLPFLPQLEGDLSSFPVLLSLACVFLLWLRVHFTLYFIVNERFEVLTYQKWPNNGMPGTVANVEEGRCWHNYLVAE